MTTPRNHRSHGHGILAHIALLAVVLGVLFFAMLLVGGVMAGRAVLQSVRPAASLNELRTDLLQCLDTDCRADIEVALPAWLTALGRVGSSIAGAEPELATALQSVHSGSIGVYELAESPNRAETIAMLEAADARLLDCERWARMVTVLADGQLIAVYGPEGDRQPTEGIELICIVLDEQELVVASAYGYLEPLLRYAVSQCPSTRGHGPRSLAVDHHPWVRPVGLPRPR